jgi:Mrp family chromosome partitioning ATPase
MMGYLGRGKVLMVQGHGREIRTAVHAMRLGRRLQQDGATIVLDLHGLHEIYPRAVGEEAFGLAAYLDGDCDLPSIIHRDARSRLHIIPAGEPIGAYLAGPEAISGLASLIEALMQAYAHVVIDGGPVGSAAEAIADGADAFAIIARGADDEALVEQVATRLEGLRGAPVFLVDDDMGAAAEPAPAPAAQWRMGAA